jgi:hypothetical protein
MTDQQTEKPQRVLLTAEQKAERRRLYTVGYWDGVRGTRALFGDSDGARVLEAQYSKGHAAGRKALEEGKVKWTPKRAPRVKPGYEVLDYAVAGAKPPVTAEELEAQVEEDSGIIVMGPDEGGVVAVNGVRADSEAVARVLEAEAVA